MGIHPRSVFMTASLDDPYTPQETQFALARALGVLQWAPPDVERFDATAIPEVTDLPHQNSYGSGVTAVVVRYPPGDFIGHLVMYENPATIAQADEFIRTMIDPTVDLPILVDPF